MAEDRVEIVRQLRELGATRVTLTADSLDVVFPAYQDEPAQRQRSQSVEDYSREYAAMATASAD